MRSEMTHYMDNLTPHEAKSAIRNRRLEKTLATLRACNRRIQTSKCRFMHTEIYSLRMK